MTSLSTLAAKTSSAGTGRKLLANGLCQSRNRGGIVGDVQNDRRSMANNFESGRTVGSCQTVTEGRLLIFHPSRRSCPNVARATAAFAA